jgi:hypothetical protein
MGVGIIVLNQQDLQHRFTRVVIGLLGQSGLSPSCHDGKYSLSCCFNKTIAEMQDLVQGRIARKPVVKGIR